LADARGGREAGSDDTNRLIDHWGENRLISPVVGSHRNALVAVVRQELAEARGTARAVLAAAESARGLAQQRRRLVRDAYAVCLNQLIGARDAARTEVLRRFRAEAAQLAGTAVALADRSATGAASAPWRMWAPTEPDADGHAGLLRVGTIAFESVTVLALVPLLDAAHVQLDGERTAVDGVIAGLLLRALGSTRPGDLRLTVYDPEALSGTLAAFAPLENAGLLSLVGPGGLGPMLDELVGTATSTGPRPERWRVVVLLADPAGAAELTSAQRTQLDRIVRTGVACGVHLVVRGLDLAPHPTVERITVHDRAATCHTTGALPVRLDPGPPAERVAEFCRSTAERYAHEVKQ
jgi:DNA segregation ATPase FtsK/SpoIIIE, S-DNA-T family